MHKLKHLAAKHMMLYSLELVRILTLYIDIYHSRNRSKLKKNKSWRGEQAHNLLHFSELIISKFYGCYLKLVD